MLRLLLTFFLLFSWLEANTEKEGLSYLNTIRIKSGLIPLRANAKLNKAAASHAKYLIQNQTHGHYEKKGKYAYTGKSPSDRVKKAGYPSIITMENISLNTGNQKKSIDNLFSAIYHRFVFLNFDKDEIGLGEYKTKKKRKVKSSHVYDLASSYISKLCKKNYPMVNGKYYMKHICRKSAKMVPQTLFIEAENRVRHQNKAVVLYPYTGQTDIWPAFYNESPDPLPKYKVSGFPLSVQFNPANTKKVKLKSFRLYDAEGKEVKKVKILQKKSDKNHVFTALEFALMPLGRLEFNTSYTAVFEAKVDGTKVKKQWSFRTKKFKEKLYRINTNKRTLTVKAGSTIILYIVPSNRRDILKGYTARGDVKATFLDQNTLRVTLPKRRTLKKVYLKFGKGKKVSFIIK